MYAFRLERDPHRGGDTVQGQYLTKSYQDQNVGQDHLNECDTRPTKQTVITSEILSLY